MVIKNVRNKYKQPLVKYDSIHITPALDEAAIWNILEAVNDPEVPVLSVVDLGIVRKVAGG
jgi:metal-sulfur cluster biosynthetic enzyme